MCNVDLYPFHRCAACNKKVKLVEMTCPCKCGKTHCKKHRMPEDHDCSFSYHDVYKQKLEQMLVIVQADKLQNKI